MRKFISLLLFIMFVVTAALVVSANLPTRTEATRENLLEDAVIDLLGPQINQAIEEHYGTTFDIGTSCERVLKIKKLDHPGSHLFDVDLEFVTFTGPHNFMDIFTIKVIKVWDTKGWIMKSYKIRKFDLKEKYECRDPA